MLTGEDQGDKWRPGIQEAGKSPTRREIASDKESGNRAKATQVKADKVSK